VRFWRCNGALMCDELIDGVTQDLTKEPTAGDREATMRYYGGRYFVCETITAPAAKIIAELLGGIYDGEKSAIATH
jgi:hypothetical protein